MTMQTECLKSTGQTLPDTEMCENAEPTILSQLTLFAGDFRVRTLVSPESGRGWKGSAQRSGQSLPVSLAKLGPDGSWLKMYQDCYQAMMDGSLETFSGTWPRAGMMQSGIVYQRQPLAPLTGGTGSSLWPTPRALVQGMECTASPYKGRSHGWDLGAAIQDAASMTPKVMWPTPVGMDWRKPNKTEQIERKANGETPYGLELRDAVQLQTPGQLNPQFVEYLMNFPKGWTDLTE